MDSSNRVRTWVTIRPHFDGFSAGFHLAGWLMAASVALAFGWLLLDMATHGFSRLSLSFLTQASLDSGRSGGIGPMLVSTFLVTAVTIIVALPMALGTAVWLNEFMRDDHWLVRCIRFSMDLLAGMPSIVMGLFGSAFFCQYLGLGFSILSGGLTLSCMVLPIMIRTAEHGLAAVSDDWRRGAAALGLTRAAALRHILLPAAAPALLAGLILGVGRAIAETAALIFTSGYVDRMPESLLDSGRTLAIHIYDLSMNVSGGDPSAYASALVLVTALVMINGVAYWLSNLARGQIIHDEN